MALIDKFNKQQLVEIVQTSSCFRDVLKKIGYTTVTGGTPEIVKHRLDILNIDYSHFDNVITKQTKRTIENVFMENSTASQATLRRWYVKGNYTEYKCSICGQESEWQGKPLTLILDHINGCNTDHRIENLRWVCPNCNQQLDTTGYKAMRVETVETENNHCIDCGVKISKAAKRCLTCENKRRTQNSINISRDELKKLIRTKTFIYIGNQYGVSDNAIRRWCDKFNLPRKKTDIEKYTDEEWEQL